MKGGSLGCRIPFRGVYVLRDNLSPKPSTPEEASAVLAPYMRLEDFKAPYREEHRYVFEPTDVA